MNLSLANNDQSLKSLIELGMKGFYPLFHPDWMREVTKIIDKKLTKKDRIKAKDILHRVQKHKGLERKKIILCSLSDCDRTLVIKYFIDLVEGRILDDRPVIQ